MPFPMKIQPIDCHAPEEVPRLEPVKPVAKSLLKRLFERQFSNVLRNSSAEKVGAAEESHSIKDGSSEFEPSSVCLAKMVQNFIEENNNSSSSNEKQSSAVRCGRNCFNGNCNDSSEDEMDSFGSSGDSYLSSSGEACEILKSLVPCASVWERNLLADTAKIVEKNKIGKRKDNFCRKVVSDGLLGLGYDASICKSRWEKSPSYPAGEYEYIDVMIEGERLLVDIDFRSEFEIARSTKTYKSVLHTLPYIFVGNAYRLQQIVTIVSEAAKQSLKKKGMHLPPWRKAEYVKAKWLSPHTRTGPNSLGDNGEGPGQKETLGRANDFELSRGRKSVDETELPESMFDLSGSSEEEKVKKAVAEEWKPPEAKPKNSQIGVKMVTGLASVIDEP